jgi:hypothetical protein
MLVDGSPVTEKVDRGEQTVVGMLGRSAGLVAGRRTVNDVSRCSLARRRLFIQCPSSSIYKRSWHFEGSQSVGYEQDEDEDGYGALVE